MKTVWCVGKWPEDNYKDFIVFENCPDTESDEFLIQEAKKAYSNDDEFYIVNH